MEYRVLRDTTELDGTCYIEFAPGRYQGTHWAEGSLFVDDDVFDLLDGCVGRGFPNFNRFGPNDVPRQQGLEVAKELRKAATALLEGRTADAEKVIAKTSIRIQGEEHDVLGRAKEIAAMMLDLSASLEAWYRDEEYVAILGI